jgi:GTP-binding protein Era
MSNSKFRSGYVSVSGVPNAGKSTLINRILGTKLLAVSDKPQTTRNKILGIFNIKDAQILFLDTPGWHEIDKDINQFYVKEAMSACQDSDVIVYLFDAPKIGQKSLNLDDSFVEAITKAGLKDKVLPVISKIDMVDDNVAKELAKKLKSRFCFKQEIHLLSSETSVGVQELISRIKELLPEGPAYYPQDELTDRNMRFLCSEIIREKVFLLTKEEIPYAVAVQVMNYEEKETLHKISAEIYVERDSQKGIIIGNGGEMIKRIGSDARKDIETLVESKVFLELFVKVKKNWTKDEFFLKELGYK